MTVGVVLPLSGAFADQGKHYETGMQLCQQTNGVTAAGKTVDLVVRDDRGPSSGGLSRRLTQELILRDHADLIVGYSFTPNAMSAASLLTEARRPAITINAATSIITAKSPYFTRISMTMSQVTYALGQWAAKNGIKTAHTIASDYAPGIDAETWFAKGFTSAGGKVLGADRTPLASMEYGAVLQRAIEAKPAAIFAFDPGEFSDARRPQPRRHGRDDGTVAILPVGVMEAHGPHLPIGTDAFIALALSRLTAGYAGAAGREALVAPPFYWGVNGVLADFVGSFRVRPQTAAMLLEDVIGSLVGLGFGEVLIISHHGDLAHNEMIRDVLLGQHGVGVRWLYTPFRWRMFARLGMTGQEPIWAPWTPTPGLEASRLTGVFGVHADEYETVAMVRHFPHTVDFEALRELPPTALTTADLPRWRKGGAEARALTPDGYFGAPNPIDPELWRHFDETAKIMAAAISRDRRQAG
ncbi:MAG TPA: creatininase family protein [Roseiarcus sp.]|nr:creatininase family protein [Roseiarcus sp.]